MPDVKETVINKEGLTGETGSPGIEGVQGISGEVKPDKVDRSHLDEVIKDRDSAKAKARQYETELTKLRQEAADRAAKEAKTAEEIQLAKLNEEGKYQEALQIHRKQFEERTSAKDKAITSKLAPLAIANAVSSIPNLTDDAKSVISDALKNRLKINPETLEEYIVDDKGEVIISKEDLKPISVAQYALDYVKGRKTFFKDTLPTGTGARETTSTSKAYTVENALLDPRLDAEWKQKDPVDYEAKAKEWAAGASDRAKAKYNRPGDGDHAINRMIRAGK